MSGWVAAAPVFLIAAAVLWLPGLAVAGGLGLRGLHLWALAPPLSVTLLAVTAVLLGAAGWSWSFWPSLLSAAVLGVLAVLLPRPALPPGAGASWPAAAGPVVGGLVVLVVAARGLGRPDALSQTFDAVFHLNAVRRGLDTGDVSSLHAGALVRPGATDAFYPAAWHAVAVAVAQLSGASVVVTANMASLAVAALVWPAGCVLLVRDVLGARDPATLVGAGLLSAAFVGFPYLLLSFGVLWPNALGTAMLPALVACACSAARSAAGIPAPRAIAVLALALPGLGLAHPNAALSLGVIVAPLAALAGADRLRGRPPRSLILSGVAATGLAAAGIALLSGSPILRMVRATDWRADETIAQAAGEVLLNAPVRSPASWTLSLLVITGAVVAARSRRTAWLPVAHLLLGLLYVLAAGSDGTVSQTLTGFWYNDAFRLAAVLPVTGVALAVIGVVTAARAVPSGSAQARTLAVLVAVVVASAGMGAEPNAARVALGYRDGYLSGAERDFVEALPRWVPPGIVVAGSPWNGSAMVYALADRPVLFPHLMGRWSPDQQLLATRLGRGLQEPAVCAAVHRLRVGFVLDGASVFWPGDGRQVRYSGLSGLAGRTGFEKVASGGRLTLYRVRPCASAPSAASPGPAPVVTSFSRGCAGARPRSLRSTSTPRYAVTCTGSSSSSADLTLRSSSTIGISGASRGRSKSVTWWTRSSSAKTSLASVG